MQKAILILNGEINEGFLSEQLRGVKPIFCADGAYNKILTLNLSVQAILGDMDSIQLEEPTKIKLIELPNQNYTDFYKALDWLAKDYTHIDIYGAGGGDWDHFINNLHVAKQFQSKLEVKFIEPAQVCFFAQPKTILNNMKHKTISLMPFPKAENVVSIGLKYPLSNHTLSLGEQTSVRNEGISEQVEIFFDSGDLIVMISCSTP